MKHSGVYGQLQQIQASTVKKALKKENIAYVRMSIYFFLIRSTVINFCNNVIPSSECGIALYFNDIIHYIFLKALEQIC